MKDSINLKTKKQIIDKSINTLKGIAKGIIADKYVYQEELDELEKWVNEYQDLKNTSPFNELIRTISNLSNNKEVRISEFEGIEYLCQQFESDYYYYDALTVDIQELHGVLRGIMSDGIINEEELDTLDKWINAHEHLSTYFPYDEIQTLLIQIKINGKYSKEDKEKIESYVDVFIKSDKSNIVEKLKESNVSMLIASDPQIEFENNIFVLTGEFQSGQKADIKKRIESLGGMVKENMIRDVNYLVVGDKGSRAWSFAAYGRKVEEALRRRKEGDKILIVSEGDFEAAYIDNK